SLPRQQVRSDDKAVRAWAARGARGESEKSTARQAATRPRAERKLGIALNIPWSRSITRPGNDATRLVFAPKLGRIDVGTSRNAYRSPNESTLAKSIGG